MNSFTQSLRMALRRLYIPLGFVFLLGTNLAHAVDDFVTDKNFLNTYYSRVKVLDGEIQTLIEEKKKLQDPTKIKETLNQVASLYRDLQETYTKYINMKDHLRFQHPEQGEARVRQYRPFRIRSESDLEGELGIDWKLRVVKSKADSIYSPSTTTSTTAPKAEKLEDYFETTTTTSAAVKPLISPPKEKPRPKLSL